MEQSRPLILYIHGFNSSPASEKAQQFTNYCHQLDSLRDSVEIAVPELSHDPEVAIQQLEVLIADANKNIFLLVGSSLGGYYATWLAEKYQCRAALINPAVSPVKTLGEDFLGPQKNLYTGKEYEFTREHALFLDTLDIDPILNPENFLLLVQKGDDVLDYRLAVNRYAGSIQVVQDGGGHRFEEFEQMIGPMLEFAEYGALMPQTRAKISSNISLTQDRQG